MKAYALALCKVAVLLRFRQSEQKAIKCMRGLVTTLAASAASDKDLIKELAQMASRLKSLDESPEEELPQDQADAIFGKPSDSHHTRNKQMFAFLMILHRAWVSLSQSN